MGTKIGKFVAKGIGNPDVGESRGEKKTPFIGAQFEVLDDPKNPPEFVGKTFEYLGWLTDATAERSVGAFTLAGCKDAANFNFAGFGSKNVEIDVENDGQYGPRIAWVNELSAGGVDDRNRLTGKAKEDAKARLRAMLGGARAPTSAAPAGAALGRSAADPFAVKAPADDGGYLAGDAANDSATTQATGTDAGVPF